MKIRRISENEVAEYYRLFLQVLKDGFPEYSSDLIKFLAEKDFSETVIKDKITKKESMIWVADEDGKLVGFLMADKLYGGVGYCSWLGVVEKMRGRGISKMLLREWEKEVIKLGGHKLILLTQSQKNRGFYQKCGFKQEGFEEKSWFGLDCWLFGKVIGEPKPEVFLK